jgi:DNA-binding transcriptional regulator YbjK
MTAATLNRRIEQLLQEVASHPHRRELVHLMRQQLRSDRQVVKQELLPQNGCTTLQEAPLSK